MQKDLIPVAIDTTRGLLVAVLACGQQDAVWERQQQLNRIRSLLREYYPSALSA